MRAGRPSKLTDALKTQAKDYLRGNWQETGDIVPSMAGLAHYLGISKQSLYTYCHKDPELLDTANAVGTLQERHLLNGGLKGEFNAGIVKSLLTRHGYCEHLKHDTNVSYLPPRDPLSILFAPTVSDE